MSKISLLALVAIVSVAPAMGQMTGTAAVAIDNLPTATVRVNATEVAIPFDVHVTASSLVCVNLNAVTFPVTLSAEIKGNATGNMSVEVIPKTMTFYYNTGTTVSVAGSYNARQTAVAVVSVPDYLPRDGTIEVVAQLGQSTGCTPTNTSPQTTEGEVDLDFEAVAPFTAEPAGEKMPGLEVGVLAVGLVIVALRRRA